MTRGDVPLTAEPTELTFTETTLAPPAPEREATPTRRVFNWESGEFEKLTAIPFRDERPDPGVY